MAAIVYAGLALSCALAAVVCCMGTVVGSPQMVSVEDDCTAGKVAFFALGVPGLDTLLCILHGFFAQAVDVSTGISTHAALFPLCGIGLPVLFLQMTETAFGFKGGLRTIHSPVWWGIACQAIGISVEFPIWCCLRWARKETGSYVPVPASIAVMAAFGLLLLIFPTAVLLDPIHLSNWWPLACTFFQFAPAAIGGLVTIVAMRHAAGDSVRVSTTRTGAPSLRRAKDAAEYDSIATTPSAEWEKYINTIGGGPSATPSTASAVALGAGYSLFAGIAFTLHLSLLLEMAAVVQGGNGKSAVSVLKSIVHAWKSNPMLAFLVWDWLICFATAVLFLAQQLGMTVAILTLLAAPVVSPGASLSVALAWRAFSSLPAIAPTRSHVD